MLLSDADRERLYQRLNQHAAAGRLGIAELERRVEAVATAGTREEAAQALADLPALDDEPVPVKRPRRGHGHGDAEAPKADWRPTAERFRDPSTNKVMRVWEDAAGVRHYVADDRR